MKKQIFAEVNAKSLENEVSVKEYFVHWAWLKLRLGNRSLSSGEPRLEEE